jgi:hypothetical protein
LNESVGASSLYFLASSELARLGNPMANIRILRVTTAANAPDDFYLVNPNSRKGVVARVYKDHAAAELLASAPDFKEALEAILRAEVCSDIPTKDDLLVELRSIARDALELSRVRGYTSSRG